LSASSRVASIVEAMSRRLVPVVSGSQRLHHLLSVSSFPRNTLCLIRPKASAPALVRGGPSTKRFSRTRVGNGSPRPGRGSLMVSRNHAAVPPYHIITCRSVDSILLGTRRARPHRSPSLASPSSPSNPPAALPPALPRSPDTSITPPTASSPTPQCRSSASACPSRTVS